MVYGVLSRFLPPVQIVKDLRHSIQLQQRYPIINDVFRWVLPDGYLHKAYKAHIRDIYIYMRAMLSIGL